MPTFSAASTTIETPVLIIGAGAAGLALAADLGRRGVPFILVDERAGDLDEPRASLIDTRSMEWMRRAGIAEAVRASALPDEIDTRLYCTRIGGFEIAQVTISQLPTRASPERAERCNQMRLDPILRELAASHADARLHFRWRVDSLKQRGDCVLAEISDLAALAQRRIAAQYVVDCSGAAGTLRSAHGLAMDEPVEPESFAQLFLRIPNAAHLFGSEPPAETVLIDSGGMRRTLESLDGRDLFRLRLDGEESWHNLEEHDAPALISEITGRDVKLQTLSRGRWRAGNVAAKRWREGNIILAGDASHRLAPSCAMGLGLAIGDATDLAWKLEARFAGWGSYGIIDGYEAERRSVAARLIEALEAERLAHRDQRPLEFHADIALDTPAGRASRKALGRQLEERHAGAPSFERLAYATSYPASPLVEGERKGNRAPPIDRRFAALIGSRAPHMMLPGGGSTLDLYGRGFVLLRLGPRAPDPGGIHRAFAHRGVPLTFHTLDDPSLAERHGARLILVRPDGHVAWASDNAPDDPLALADRVRGAIG